MLQGEYFIYSYKEFELSSLTMNDFEFIDVSGKQAVVLAVVILCVVKHSMYQTDCLSQRKMLNDANNNLCASFFSVSMLFWRPSIQLILFLVVTVQLSAIACTS